MAKAIISGADMSYFESSTALIRARIGYGINLVETGNNGK